MFDRTIQSVRKSLTNELSHVGWASVETIKTGAEMNGTRQP